MSEITIPARLEEGTLIRHKVAGYEGRIDGITEIRTCFTAKGELLDNARTKDTFQYRVAVQGEAMRRIAPAEDLEILEGVTLVTCPSCSCSFKSKPGVVDKAGGHCQCGGWVCPACLDCRAAGQDSRCPKRQRRLARKLGLQKKTVTG